MTSDAIPPIGQAQKKPLGIFATLLWAVLAFLVALGRMAGGAVACRQRCRSGGGGSAVSRLSFSRPGAGRLAGRRRAHRHHGAVDGAACAVRLVRHHAGLPHRPRARLDPLAQRFDHARAGAPYAGQSRKHDRDHAQGRDVGMSDIAALGAQAETMIAALAKISAEPARLVRLYLSPAHRRAAELVAGWMRETGLTVSEDALRTQR